MHKKTLLLSLALFSFLSFTGNSAAAEKGRARMVPWSEAERIFPRYDKFTVVDMETGWKFKVQRRAGSRHADVQPLTSKDTAIMKKIYNGQWSWRRRAVYVLNGKKRVAASMNGMPHGAGALKNSFPGHFCIHFYKSSTHSKREMDLSHKLMVYKAAGRLGELLGTSNPYEAAQYYVAGFKEQDKRILSQLSAGKLNWQPMIRRVENAKISRMPLLPAEDMADELAVALPIQIDFQIKGEGRHVADAELKFFRPSPYHPWQIDSRQFLKDTGLAGQRKQEKSNSGR